MALFLPIFYNVQISGVDDKQLSVNRKNVSSYLSFKQLHTTCHFKHL